MEPITLEKLALAVKKMRNAQKQYFKFRTQVFLKKSIALEAAVDDMIRPLDLPEEKENVQQNLF